jgi:hypothetical protein
MSGPAHDLPPGWVDKVNEIDWSILSYEEGNTRAQKYNLSSAFAESYPGSKKGTIHPCSIGPKRQKQPNHEQRTISRTEEGTPSSIVSSPHLTINLIITLQRVSS